MKMYEVNYPSLEITVKFKHVSYEAALDFHSKNKELPKIEYILHTLDLCVFNLQTTVKAAMQKLSSYAADEALMSLYNGCIMLNPILDPETWIELTYSYNLFKGKETIPESTTESKTTKKKSVEPKKEELILDPGDEKKLAKQKRESLNAKFSSLEKILNTKIIGQTEAIVKISNALKRAHAGLSDQDRPLGVFLFAGPSGVGKTLIAKELQKYLYGETDLVRIDCGEYQHKHENQKLIGSPPGFVGYDEGGQLTKAISQNQKTVLLLDEAEKAHPDFWNTFLKVFDDGFITDAKGHRVSFKDVVIIMTSNLGNDVITENTYSRGTGFTASVQNDFKSKKAPKREYVERETLEAIRKFFKPEMINRLDEIVVFNHLAEEDFAKIAELEMRNLSDKMLKIDLDIRWDEATVQLLANKSGACIEGARGMAKIRREELENPLADAILSKKLPKNKVFNISTSGESFIIQ